MYSHERLDNVRVDVTVERVKVLLEVLVAVLEHEGQLPVRVQDIVKPVEKAWYYSYLMENFVKGHQV